MISNNFYKYKYIAIVFILLGTSLLIIGSKKDIVLIINGEMQNISTYAWRVGGVIAGEDIMISNNDDVFPDKGTWIQDGQIITVRKSRRIYLQVESELYEIQTIESIPANILLSKGINLYPGDNVYLFGNKINSYEPINYPGELYLSFHLGQNSSLSERENNQLSYSIGQALWDKNFELSIYDDISNNFSEPIRNSYYDINSNNNHLNISNDGVTINANTVLDNVGEILNEDGMGIQGLDFSNPGITNMVSSQKNIQIVRVQEEIVLEQELIPFYTQWQPVEDLEIDNFSLVQPGEYGLQANRIRIQFVDGQETIRVIEDQWIVREPVPRIEGYGTNIIVRTLDTPNGVVAYWRAIEVYATSYTASTAGTPISAPNYGITYSGELLRTGHIAVLRSWYPSMGGRSIYVPGYGVGVVADIGGGFSDRDWIDLGYYEDEWISWHNYITIYFLTPIPPADQILWVIP